MDMDITATRKALGLSQAALAEKLGVTQSTVSRWEKNPDPRTILALEALKAKAEPGAIQ